jgi:RNA polymerase sigma-70 factor, ECF subfamily
VTTQLNAEVERVFREDYGRVLAGLIRVFGDFDVAEDALQEAFLIAVDRWPVDGFPSNPGGWLTIAARRKGLDRLRREQTLAHKQRLLEIEQEHAMAVASAGDDPDNWLRLIFTCCHPALNLQAQIALTLRTLCGLSVAEIARAFLTPESTVSQWLVRAKRKIKLAGIPFQIPPEHMLPERLKAVLGVIYLMFNEGYAASSGAALVRNDLAAEAIRLGRMLLALMPDEGEVMGLLALMLLHDSRRRARIGPDGDMVLLDEQDRRLWDRAEIDEGVELLDRALRLHRAPNQRVGPMQLQAAIAAVHAQAPRSSETDWAEIDLLYRELLTMNDTPVVRLNRAVAVAMSEGPDAGLQLVRAANADGALVDYHLYHAAEADLLRRLGLWHAAADAYRRALDLTANAAEQRFLRRRLSEVAAHN